MRTRTSSSPRSSRSPTAWAGRVRARRRPATRALGTDPDVDVDTFTIEPQAGDTFLICSDGLTTMVGDETILNVLEEHRGALDEAAEELVKLANKAGGEDNITVIAFELTDEP